MLNCMEKIYLVCPMSLGDYFVCNALVLNWARQSHEVHIPVVPQFMATISSLYSDHTNIKIVPFLGNEIEDQYIKEHQLHVINFRTIFELVKLPLAGSSDPVDVPVHWDRQIYEYFDVPFSKRYLNFQMPQSLPNSLPLMHKLNPDGTPYVLWHKHTSKHVGGMGIDLVTWRPAAGLPDKKIIEVELGNSPNLLDYWDLIQNADEIHCVPSSFHQLVDSVSAQLKATLFYHDLRRDTINQINSRWNGAKWNRVEYGVKI